jgi:beta-glucanase (GH16 family)
VSRLILHCTLLIALGALMSCNAGSTHSDPGDNTTDTTLSAIVATHTLYAEDDFIGPPNSAPGPKFWNIETGGRGWGAHEAQTYTADPRNVRQDGQGNLVIEADGKNDDITSARLNTDGKVELTNGLIAARIKMPAGQGVHPAFWMLGSSLDDVGWPACGEVDIVETLKDGSTAYFTIIGPPVDGQAGPDSHFQLQSSILFKDLVDNFHTYWLFKQPQKLIVGIDEKPVATFNAGDLPKGAQWVYDGPFFAVLNVAIGGEWPGPLGPGVLPKQMTVDWVKFYR